MDHRPIPRGATMGLRAPVPMRIWVSVALVGLCAAVFAYVELTRIVRVADGRVDVTLKFAVIDSETQSPVAGAIVRLRKIASENPEVSSPEGEDVAEAVTDVNGLVEVPYRFRFSSVERHYSEDVKVSVPYDVWVQAEARGYRPTLMNVHRLLGGSRRYDELPFPTGALKLRGDLLQR